MTVSSTARNVLEWFDFAVFGYFADIISEQFFPKGNPVAALAETFAIFAGAFLMRPVGGIFFGYIGDRYVTRPTRSNMFTALFTDA